MALPSAFSCTLSGPSLSGTRNIANSGKYYGDSEAGLIAQVPASTTDQLCTVAFTYTTIQLLYMLATGGDLTVVSNATDHAGGDTMTLLDGKATIYTVGGPYANPFAHNVTKLYVTNAGADPVQFDFYVLNDAP